ncbi:MAG: hypothetical protein K8R69_04415 [Deltaproteobacteria bacterium]|nr:hypothetical protein [Deltaproteobacteria bacterium]
MRRRSMTRAMLAGFMATLAMAFLGFLATRMGMPFLNWAKTFGHSTGGPMFGYLAFFIVGVVMAVIYVAVFHERLPGSSWKRGLFFSFMMWVATGAALAPLLHLGFFMGSLMVALGTLMTYMLYGGVLGYLYDA